MLSVLSRCSSFILLVWTGTVWSEEACTSDGTKYQGQLSQEQGRWIFRTSADKNISLGDISYIRFMTGSAEIPRAPLTHTLRFNREQRLTGQLIHVDDKTVRFLSSWGSLLTLSRGQIMSLEIPEDWLPMLPPQENLAWQTTSPNNKVTMDREQLLFGHAAIRLDSACSRISCEWQLPHRVSRLACYLRLGANDPSSIWIVTPTLNGYSEKQSPVLIHDKSGMHCEGTQESFGSVDLHLKWAAVVLERNDNRLRFFVNDLCLGQTQVPHSCEMKGIQFSASRVKSATEINHQVGRMWLADFTVARHLPHALFPGKDSVQDFLWLVHGEQVFGHVLAADHQKVTLNSKFGKRTFPWSQLRGVVFAGKSLKPVLDQPTLYFRSAAGMTADCLRAKLSHWKDSRLIVQHDLLGEIAIERSQLEKITSSAN